MGCHCLLLRLIYSPGYGLPWYMFHKTVCTPVLLVECLVWIRSYVLMAVLILLSSCPITRGERCAAISNYNSVFAYLSSQVYWFSFGIFKILCCL